MNAPQPKFPLLVKRGSVAVKIYRTQSAQGYQSFQVADYSGGQRRFRTFSDFNHAKREAVLIARRLAGGDADVLELRSQDRAAYLRALELLKPSGAPLEICAAQYAKAVEILGGDFVVEAARFYVKRNPARLPVKRVAEVVEELLAAKKQSGAGDRYLQDLRYRG